MRKRRKKEEATNGISYIPPQKDATSKGKHHIPFEGETEDEWMGDERARASSVAWRRVSHLVKKELQGNEDEVSRAVGYLCTQLMMKEQMYDRVSGIVCYSLMGQYVDEHVYLPMLREKLSSAIHNAVRMVPLAPNSTYKEALEEACGKGVRSSEESLMEQFEDHTVIFVLTQAERWTSEAGAMLLRSLASLCGRLEGRLTVGAVVWVSSESQGGLGHDAYALQWLRCCRAEFISPSVMMHNVLYTLFVQPNLPLSLPADVYRWILEHCTERTDSLPFLMHILHFMITHHYFHAPAAWLPEIDLHSYDGKNLRKVLYSLTPSLKALPEDKLLDRVDEKLASWRAYREHRATMFTWMFRILVAACPLRAVPKQQPLACEWGDYLNASEKAGGLDRYRVTLVDRLHSWVQGVADGGRQLVKRVHRCLLEDDMPEPMLLRLIEQGEEGEEEEQEVQQQQQQEESPSALDMIFGGRRGSGGGMQDLLRRRSSSGSASRRQIKRSLGRSADLEPVARVLEWLMQGPLRAIGKELPLTVPWSFSGGIEELSQAVLGRSRRDHLAAILHSDWRSPCNEDLSAAAAYWQDAPPLAGGLIDLLEWYKDFEERAGEGASEESVRQRFETSIRELSRIGLIEQTARQQGVVKKNFIFL